MNKTIRYLQGEAKTNWIRTQEPEIWAKTHKIVLLSGYITHKLVGKFVDSVSCQVTHLPFDYKNHRWAGDFDWKWQAVPVEREKLVDLVPSTGLLGEISAQAAEETGIPAGLPLIAAAADKACEVLGSGTLAPHICCLSFGTASTINTIHQKYVEVIPSFRPIRLLFLAPIPLKFSFSAATGWYPGS